MEELRETVGVAFPPSRNTLWRIRRIRQFKIRRKGYQPLENYNTLGECYEEPLVLRKCVSLQDYRSFDFDADKVEKVIEDSCPRGVLEGLDVALNCSESDGGSSGGSASYFNVLGQRSYHIPWQVLLQGWRPAKSSVKRLYSTVSVPRLGVPKVLWGKFNSKIRRAPPAHTTCKLSWKNFSISELEAATDNFSQDNMIGMGGYAEVYKGCLDGQYVAIKRLIHGTSDEQTKEFLSELGIVVHLNHPNTAKLIGFGIEGGLFLVLQLSEHGSLSSFLHGSNEKLDWSSRNRVAIGTAEGLQYLHEKCQRRIIHRDIKTSNILLTKNFEPQISDFGLAKWLPDKLTHYTLSSLEGTFGYLAPEYLMHGIVNEKVDVFAYGVLLLELITGREAIDSAKQSLVIWAKPLLEKKKFNELVDPFLGDAFDSTELKRMTNTAYLCIQQSSILRPRMSQVLKLLRGDDGRAEPMEGHHKTLMRTYSEELHDVVEYNATRHLLNDLRQLKKLDHEI